MPLTRLLLSARRPFVDPSVVPGVVSGAFKLIELIMKSSESSGPGLSFPKVAQEGPVDHEYDFELDIPSIEALASAGWPVRCRSEELMALIHENDKAPTINTPCANTGILGYYSKGKTFVVNGLVNSGAVAKSTDKGKLHEDIYKFLYGTDEARKNRTQLKMGHGVTTKGISGKFIGFNPNEKVEAARMLLLDTAGRNAPAVMPPRSDQKDDTEVLRKAIFSLRSKERLIDDISVDVCDNIIYVVDEVLNEDQRTIQWIINEIQSTKQKLFIVHNWKRLKYRDEATLEQLRLAGSPDFGAYKKELDALIAYQDEQLLGAFQAQPAPLPAAPMYEQFGNITFWKSRWKNNDVEVLHAVLFKDDDRRSYNWNANVFSYLFTQLQQPILRESLAMSKAVLNRVSASVDKHLADYADLVDKALAPADEPKQKPSTTRVKTAKTGREVDEKSVHGHIQLQQRQKGINLHEWELREMPSKTSGTWIPSICVVENKPTETSNAHTHYIRVDLPGFKREDKNNVPLEDAQNHQDKTWFNVDFDARPSVEKPGHEHTVIFGYRAKPSNFDTRTDSYGYFQLEFAVNFLFNKHQTEKQLTELVKLENGCLTITRTYIPRRAPGRSKN